MQTLTCRGCAYENQSGLEEPCRECRWDGIRSSGYVAKPSNSIPSDCNEVTLPSGIKDSGARTEFPTGAVRDGRTGKGRFDLLPIMALFRLARHFEAGCEKYGDRNWENGIPISTYMDSAMRHLLKFIAGFADEAHLTAAIWNLMCASETMDRIELGLLPGDLNNLPYTYNIHHESSIDSALRNPL